MDKNVWLKYDDSDKEILNKLCNEYREYISLNKTERENVETVINTVTSLGYKELSYYIESNEGLKAGDKIYVNNRNKSIALFVIGKEDITKGMNILGAHIDSPRLDLKANPIYEDSELCYFDTHYYGGIKKYQWLTLPLALHGVVCKKDGTKVNICVGEHDEDPVVGITDLLPHLGKKQMEKNASTFIDGEGLDILIGSIPYKFEGDSEKDAVKANLLNILKNRYDISEEDFISAEIEVVPSGKARNFGLDQSMIMAYGQDDKVCAYSSLRAFLDVEECDKTISCILVDKEEIGSVGATGMHSSFYENAVMEICELLGVYSFSAANRVFSNSKMLSSDVNAAYDPLYSDVMDKRNASYFNQGVVFSKYTGSRGKSESNDADCEYIAEIRKVMADNNVHYQFSELGKVDAGGGGTIAYILANKNVSVIDCGVAVMSMHAPWEITAKADIYEAYKCYKAFLKNM